MTALLLIVAAAVVALTVGRWWTLAPAPVLGLAAAAVIAATGGSLRDTPLPFAVLTATLVCAGALVARRRLAVRR